MRRFAIVFVQEFRETLRSKPFRVISVFLAVILILAAAVGSLLMCGGAESQGDYIDYTDGGATTEHTITYIGSIAVDDRTQQGLTERLREEMPLYRFEEMPLDETAIQELISGEKVDACVVLTAPDEFELYEQSEMFVESWLGEEISEALALMIRTDDLEQLGITEDQAREVLTGGEVWYTIHQVEKSGSGGSGIGMYVYNYIMIILMFLIIGLYGQMVATRVATEKSSRTMEVLATSVSPVELLCGKVLGVGAAGFAQMSVFVALAAAIVRGAMATSPVLSVVAEQILSVSGGDIICLALYFLLGFMLYAFIFGALGSMVSQIEDLSGLVSMPLYLFMIGYFIAIISASSGQPGTLMKAASFVPFWSPVTMLGRMAMEAVPAWELAVSILLLALTAAFMAWLSARVYRTGMLRYGKPPRVREIIDAARKGRG